MPHSLLVLTWLVAWLLVWPGIAWSEDEDRWWEQPPGTAQPGGGTGETPWWQRPPGAGMFTDEEPLRSQEEAAAAELMARDQLTAARQTFGEGHPQTVATMGGLAYTLKAQGKWAEAESYYQQLLAQYAQQDGPQAYGALTILPELIEALRQQGKEAEAIAVENKLQALRLQRDQSLPPR